MEVGSAQIPFPAFVLPPAAFCRRDQAPNQKAAEKSEGRFPFKIHRVRKNAQQNGADIQFAQGTRGIADVLIQRIISQHQVQDHGQIQAFRHVLFGIIHDGAAHKQHQRREPHLGRRGDFFHQPIGGEHGKGNHHRVQPHGQLRTQNRVPDQIQRRQRHGINKFAVFHRHVVNGKGFFPK